MAEGTIAQASPRERAAGKQGLTKSEEAMLAAPLAFRKLGPAIQVQPANQPLELSV